MTQWKVPPEVSEFVARYLPSVEHLNVFMLLQRDSARFWRFASDNLLDIKISNDVLYRFNPATRTLDAAAKDSANDYRRERLKRGNHDG